MFSTEIDNLQKKVINVKYIQQPVVYYLYV